MGQLLSLCSLILRSLILSRFHLTPARPSCSPPHLLRTWTDCIFCGRHGPYALKLRRVDGIEKTLDFFGGIGGAYSYNFA